MDENLKIAISCDHAGKNLSLYIIEKFILRYYKDYRGSVSNRVS